MTEDFVLARDCEGNIGSGETNLLTACSGDNIELVKYFHELNPEHINACDKHGGTPLHPPAANGLSEIVEYLLQKGASPDLENSNSQTPLTLAVKYGHSDLVEILLRHGADPDIPEPINDFLTEDGDYERAISLLRQARERTQKS
jgi:ankyrin repeat protein